MTRPGFIIPDANLVAPDYQAAQPDQGDFLVLGNHQYGVITGCKVNLSFPSVSLSTDVLGTTAHILVCAGVAYLLSGAATLSLAGRGSQGRWDLIVFDSLHGGFKVVTGTPADNPVFPDITDTMTVLAAVSVPSTGSSATPTCIDKRAFLATGVTGDALSPSLLRSYDTSVPTPVMRVNIDGNGKVSWGTTTSLESPSAGVVKVTSELQAKVVTAATSATVAGFDVVTTATINWGTSRPGSADTGDIFVNTTTGDVSIWRGGGWVAINSDIRPGTVIMSFESPATMGGWLPLVGQVLAVGLAGSLPTLHPDWVSGGNITMPDMRGRVAIGGGYIDASNPGFVTAVPHGVRVDDHGSASATVDIANLPAHTHQEGDLTGLAGGHVHSGATAAGGATTTVTAVDGYHGHNISDPGHGHDWGLGWPWVDDPRGSGFAQGSIDMVEFDDTVGFVSKSEFSNVDSSRVSVLGGGAHSHELSLSNHVHAFTGMSTAPDHVHTLPANSSVGSGQPLLITPPSLNLYFYIKI